MRAALSEHIFDAEPLTVGAVPSRSFDAFAPCRRRNVPRAPPRPRDSSVLPAARRRSAAVRPAKRIHHRASCPASARASTARMASKTRSTGEAHQVDGARRARAGVDGGQLGGQDDGLDRPVRSFQQTAAPSSSSAAAHLAGRKVGSQRGLLLFVGVPEQLKPFLANHTEVLACRHACARLLAGYSWRARLSWIRP